MGSSCCCPKAVAPTTLTVEVYKITKKELEMAQQLIKIMNNVDVEIRGIFSSGKWRHDKTQLVRLLAQRETQQNQLLNIMIRLQQDDRTLSNLREFERSHRVTVERLQSLQRQQVEEVTTRQMYLSSEYLQTIETCIRDGDRDKLKEVLKQKHGEEEDELSRDLRERLKQAEEQDIPETEVNRFISGYLFAVNTLRQEQARDEERLLRIIEEDDDDDNNDDDDEEEDEEEEETEEEKEEEEEEEEEEGSDDVQEDDEFSPEDVEILSTLTEKRRFLTVQEVQERLQIYFRNRGLDKNLMENEESDENSEDDDDDGEEEEEEEEEKEDEKLLEIDEGFVEQVRTNPDMSEDEYVRLVDQYTKGVTELRKQRKAERDRLLEQMGQKRNRKRATQSDDDDAEDGDGDQDESVSADSESGINEDIEQDLQELEVSLGETLLTKGKERTDAEIWQYLKEHRIKILQLLKEPETDDHSVDTETQDNTFDEKMNTLDEGFVEQVRTKPDMSEDDYARLVDQHMKDVTELRKQRQAERDRLLERLRERRKRKRAGQSGDDISDDDADHEVEQTMASLKGDLLGVSREEVQLTLERYRQQILAFLVRQRSKPPRPAKRRRRRHRTDFEEKIQQLNEEFVQTNQKNPEIPDDEYSRLLKNHVTAVKTIRKQREATSKELKAKLEERKKQRKGDREKSQIEEDDDWQSQSDLKSQEEKPVKDDYQILMAKLEEDRKKLTDQRKSNKIAIADKLAAKLAAKRKKRRVKKFHNIYKQEMVQGEEGESYENGADGPSGCNSGASQVDGLREVVQQHNRAQDFVIQNNEMVQNRTKAALQKKKEERRRKQKTNRKKEEADANTSIYREDTFVRELQSMNKDGEVSDKAAKQLICTYHGRQSNQQQYPTPNQV